MKSATTELQISDLPADIRQEIYAHVCPNADHEVGGVLVGTVDGRSGRPRVTGTIAALEAVGERASVTFTHDAWEAIIETQEREFPNTQIVGWYHSHPDFGIFLSEHDIFIHDNFFPDGHQVAYVVDPVGRTEGIFGWRDGKVQLFDEGEMPAVDLETGVPLQPLASRMVIELEDEGDDEAPARTAIRVPPDYAAASAATHGASSAARRNRRVVELGEPEKQESSNRGLIAAAVGLVAVVIVAIAVFAMQSGSESGPTSANGKDITGQVGAVKAAERAAAQERDNRQARDAALAAIASESQRTRWVKPVAPKPVERNTDNPKPINPDPVSPGPASSIPANPSPASSPAERVPPPSKPTGGDSTQGGQPTTPGLGGAKGSTPE